MLEYRGGIARFDKKSRLYMAWYVYLLEEICDSFPFGTLEATILEKLQDSIPRTVVDCFAFGH